MAAGEKQIKNKVQGKYSKGEAVVLRIRYILIRPKKNL